MVGKCAFEKRKMEVTSHISGAGESSEERNSERTK
jgi:hypothetical protein